MTTTKPPKAQGQPSFHVCEGDTNCARESEYEAWVKGDVGSARDGRVPLCSVCHSNAKANGILIDSYPIAAPASPSSQHQCPVCGYGKMPYAPVPYNICPCCGMEFGVDDRNTSHLTLQANWIANGAKWFDDITQPPADWNPLEQARSLRPSSTAAADASVAPERIWVNADNGLPYKKRVHKTDIEYTRSDLTGIDHDMAALTDVLSELSEAGVDLEEREIGMELGIDRSVKVVEKARDEFAQRGWMVGVVAADYILTALLAEKGEKGNEV